MQSRRDFVKVLGLASLGLACRGSMDGPPCAPRMVGMPAPPEPGGFLPDPERIVWVVTDYTGPQRGTKDQPFAIAPEGWDSFMNGIAAQGGSWQVNAPSHYLTNGALEWGPIAAPWRLGSNCRIDLQGSGTLELHTAAIPDEYLLDVPIHLICSAEGFTNGLSPEEAWKQVPFGQTVRNGRMIANHSKMVDRAQGLGKKLMISGAILQGHGAAIEDMVLEDFGAWGQEAFPMIILGIMAGPDRHVLSFLDPTKYIFDDPALGYPRSHISRCTFDKYATVNSNAQVTVFLIGGSQGSQVIQNPWHESGPWTHLLRHNPYISECQGFVRDGNANNNQCQLTTIYQCTEGEIVGCRSEKFQAGTYGDYTRTFNLDVHHNTHLECLRGVAQLLSPTSGDSPTLAETFISSGLKARHNFISVIPTDAAWHGGICLLKLPDAPTPQQITNVLVDDNDVVMLGSPGKENVAIRAERIDGLTITPTNRFHGFRNNTSINYCTDVKEPKDYCTDLEKLKSWPRRNLK